MEQNQFAFHLEIKDKKLKAGVAINYQRLYQAALLSIAGNAALISFWFLNNSHDIGQRLPASRI